MTTVGIYTIHIFICNNFFCYFTKMWLPWYKMMVVDLLKYCDQIDTLMHQDKSHEN